MNDPDGFGVRRCCVPDCGTLVPRYRELPVCRDCGVKIAIAHLNDAERLHAVRAELRREREVRVENVRYGRTPTACVYYVRLDDDRIKIGFTSQIKQRLSSLRVLPSALLALEPGGRDREAEVHRQFAAERLSIRREDFAPSPRLLDHIAAVREEHGLPRWATLPDTHTITRRQA